MTPSSQCDSVKGVRKLISEDSTSMLWSRVMLTTANFLGVYASIKLLADLLIFGRLNVVLG